MYCCDNFKIKCEQKNRIIPNIRIVKFVSDFLINVGKGVDIVRDGQVIKVIDNSKSSYRFYISYTNDKFKLSSPLFLFISFCPHCGQNLYKFYNKDEYANEIEGDTFTL
jgi:hypothetical protein